MDFVLDNSVAMRWHLPTKNPSDKQYADRVWMSMRPTQSMLACAWVPNLWHLEAVSVLLKAEKRGEITMPQLKAAIRALQQQPIDVDEDTAKQVFGRTLGLAKQHKLSGYDAAYLELAIRKGLPLATLDKDLRAAAQQESVAIYQP